VKPTVSIVIVSKNEGRDLIKTCRSINTVCPDLHQLIVVDDDSDPPEPYCTIRNVERLGVAGSRHVGALAATGDVIGFMDAHMKLRPGDIEVVAQTAWDTGGFAYAGCNGHHLAGIRWEGGILRGKWRKKQENGPVRTSGMMGAFYFIRRDVLERIGGWVWLPGHWGMDEEAMTVLVLKHNLPITAHTDIQTWHLFRGQGEKPVPVPYPLAYDKYQLNIAAMYRLLFEDSTWANMRGVLGSLTIDGVHRPIPQYILDDCEEPSLVAYGRAIRERCLLSDEELFEKIEAMVAKERKEDGVA